MLPFQWDQNFTKSVFLFLFFYVKCHCILCPPPPPSSTAAIFAVPEIPSRRDPVVICRILAYRITTICSSRSRPGHFSLSRELRDIVPAIPEPHNCSMSKSKQEGRQETFQRTWGKYHVPPINRLSLWCYSVFKI